MLQQLCLCHLGGEGPLHAHRMTLILSIAQKLGLGAFGRKPVKDWMLVGASVGLEPVAVLFFSLLHLA